MWTSWIFSDSYQACHSERPVGCLEPPQHRANRPAAAMGNLADVFGQELAGWAGPKTRRPLQARQPTLQPHKKAGATIYMAHAQLLALLVEQETQVRGTGLPGYSEAAAPGVFVRPLDFQVAILALHQGVILARLIQSQETPA
ncbi:MAG: hypothetical protein HYR94_05830 [Chloroflexi bacterium]|nr:hypothetical protein [Chloroflexota bacterium]